ncbi:MAG TPA: hypothetical protein VGL23_21800, partial [Chloroflexota bacterium]
MVELSGRTVVAAFKHRAQAQRAIDALLDAGFDETSIAIEASEEWHHHEQEETIDASSADVEPGWRRAPARWPVPAGAFLGGAVAASAAWLNQRRHAWWQRGGWARGEIALVAAGAVVGAAGGLALMTAWRRQAAPAAGELYGRVEYDQGSLERGHAIVTVAPGERMDDAETLLRA